MHGSDTVTEAAGWQKTGPGAGWAAWLPGTWWAGRSAVQVGRHVRCRTTYFVNSGRVG